MSTTKRDTVPKDTEDVLIEAEIVRAGDEHAALVRLWLVRDELAEAERASAKAMTGLRDLIVKVRPTGALSVDEMAEAIGRPDRNYIDSVWSNFGETHKGKQTRAAEPNATSKKRDAMKHGLVAAASNQSRTAGALKAARAERDRTVAIVYASKVLGPTAIAKAVGIDRNHVLRLARRAGVAPAHRAGARNQYSVDVQGGRSDGAQPKAPRKRAAKKTK